MRIVVTIKQVPDPDVPAGSFQIDPSGQRALSPPGVAPIMNGYDANALEAALRLKEAHGGSVVALGLGPPETRDALKRAIAMGADAAFLVDAPSGDLDSWATASALAAALRRIGSEGEPVDLVLCGRQASDTDAGQVPLGIAALLDLPALAPVQKVEWRDGLAVVERMTEDGYQVVELRPPALLAVSSEVGEPRYPPLRGVMMAGRAQIPAWTPAELGAPDVTPRRRLRRLRVEQREARVEMIKADSGAEAGRILADRLREAKLI